MKNLYPKAKGKGKIHPSADALAVLTLLPAATLALTAALGYEDKEVLAYLITRSLHGPLSSAAAAETEKKKRRSSSSQVHSPLFDCGCFDCYTSFWIRWDSSPDRELIHQVIEAFEEHLACSEKMAKGGGGRRRERRGIDRSEKKKNSKALEEEVAAAAERVVEVAVDASMPMTSSSMEVAEEKAGSDEEEADGDEAEELAAGQMGNGGGGGGERRKSWPDVMGLFNSRLWSLWSPGV